MKNLRNFTGPLSIIIIAALIRLFPHAPNFAPIGAMALYGGTYLSKKYSIVVIIATLVLSDYLLLYINPFAPIFINFSKFYPPTSLIHSTTIFVYGSFVLISLVGSWLRKNKSFKNILLASLASSILFFLITNFGVWVVGAYSRDISGLLQSYIMGVPFFRNTLFSDVFYTGAFFTSYELVHALLSKRSPVFKFWK